MTGRELFKKTRWLIDILILFFKILPKFIKVFIWDCSSRYSQKIFIAIRYLILKSMIEKCGDNVRIGKNVTIIAWEKLSLGNNISIHDGCYIDASGGIDIEDNVSIAHQSSILSSNHGFSDKSLPIKYNELQMLPVRIYSDVWIGCGCRILGGINISSRSIVAAGAVVNKSIPPNSIFGGVPAKFIKEI